MAVMDANNVGDIPAEGQAAAEGQAPEVTPEGSGLPSEGEEQVKSPWDRAREDGYLPEDFKEDPYELAKSLKNAQDFVAEANKEKGKQGQADAAAQVEADKARILREEIVPEFLASGKQLTDEIKQKALDAGYDTKDIELAYYKFNENATKAYSVVGGEEVYAQMMSEMAPKMSESERASFDAAFDQGVSEYAIKGLYAEWKGGQSAQPGRRIEGKVPGGGGVKPYTSQGEMLKDLNYLKTTGKTDMNARKKYEARKSATPDNILFGRK